MFYNNIKKYREMKRWTQTKLSEKIEEITDKPCSTENVKSWEKGTNPKVEIIYALAKAFNVPVQFLFNDTLEEMERVYDSIGEMINKETVKKENLKVCDAYENKHLDIDPRFLGTDINAKLFYLKVQNDNFRPTLSKNDTVIFRKIEPNEVLDNGLYIIESNGIFRIREVIFLSDGSLELRSGETKEMIKNQSLLFGLVVGRVGC